MKEIWKLVQGYEHYLEVSNLGRVRGLDRMVNSGYSDYILKGKLKALNPDKQGYLGVGVSNLTEGWRKRLQVHQVVALNFIPNPLNKPCVNHKDGDKSNNRVDNLEWVTYSENTHHAIKTGLLNNSGENNVTSKLNMHQVNEIRSKFKDRTLSYSKIGKLYNVSGACIRKILLNMSYNN